MDTGKNLSVKASRLLAGQLAHRPQDFGSDARLIATLAAEAVDSVQTDVTSLRQAVLKRYVNGLLGQAPQQLDPQTELDLRIPACMNPVHAQAPAKPPAGKVPPSITRPDLDGFAQIVLRKAEREAEGWPGNRKAYISRVWRAVELAHPEWGLSEIEFKGMLTEAHRTGHIVLANADLKNKDALRDVEDSEITYKNTVWHFVRVEG